MDYVQLPDRQGFTLTIECIGGRGRHDEAVVWLVESGPQLARGLVLGQHPDAAEGARFADHERLYGTGDDQDPGVL